jgi:hypothetical protein
MSLRTLGAALALKARNARRRRRQSVGLSLLDRLVSNRLALFPFAHLEQPPASGRAGGNGQTSPAGSTPSGRSTSEPPSFVSGRWVDTHTTNRARNALLLPSVHHAHVATSPHG